jgi:hypothetical protein
MTIVALASPAPKLSQKIVVVTISSTMVGKMLNRMKYSIVSMLLVPRSTTRVSDPVRRSRWNRSDSLWMCANTSCDSCRAAICPTRSKMALRTLSNRTPEKRATA